LARLEIRNVSKRFGATQALDDVSLSVNTGEFIALLGPSGCGKTTLLRLLAGFEPVDSGEIILDGQPLSGPAHHIATEERGIGMVFQSYALWPHMTVAENVEFALKVRRIPGPKRREIVADSLAAVGLGDMGSRSPSTLSGGQRQRVALARCLAMQPRLVLLDEPLANLDVHLRDSMQEEFRTFHDRTGATMVYVTHDQAEALALADRIAVMSHGKILQDASGPDLYRRPANAEVARFIGRGMVLPCSVKQVEPANSAHDGHCEAAILSATVRLRCGATTRPGPAEACLRTEDLRLAPLNGSTDTLPARVSRVVFQGAVALVETRLEAAGEPALRVAVPPLDAPSAGSRVSIQVGDGWVLPA
jgi:iron(III) transport system ATP-binding protein